MSYYIHSSKKGTFRLEVDTCDIHESPRDWDNAARMLCWHNRYSLGDEKDRQEERLSNELDSWDEIERWITREKKALAILPLNLYDHSGITMSIGRGRGWDNGVVGFIYLSSETLTKQGWTLAQRRKELKADKDFYYKLLRQEVKTYDQYLTGDVYYCKLEVLKRDLIGYEGVITVPGIFDPWVSIIPAEATPIYAHYFDEVESCSGFYGSEGIQDFLDDNLGEWEDTTIAGETTIKRKGLALDFRKDFDEISQSELKTLWEDEEVLTDNYEPFNEYLLQSA